jgi:outer membrane lipoprotein-sorting protein
MKRLCIILLFTVSSSAFAGLTYKTQSSTTGMQNINIVGTVSVEGSHMRLDVAKGDNMMFKDNAVVLSNNGGKTLSVYDPAARTYFDLQLQDLIGNTSAMLRNLGDMVKFSFDNPQVSVRDAGDGGSIEGFPTHKYVLDASYDMNIDAMGQKLTTHMTMNTETWTTEQLSSEMTNFLQMRGIRTGIEGIDKLIEAQSTNMHGFPLKQISTVHISQGGNDMTMTTTSSVTDVVKKTIDASNFAAPAGYTKVDDPITKMIKAMKQ